MWAWVYKVLMQNGGLCKISTKNITDTVEKPPPSPQKILLKFFLKSALPPLKICESVTLTKYFFYLAESGVHCQLMGMPYPLLTQWQHFHVGYLLMFCKCTQFKNKFIGSKVNFPLERFCIQFMWEKGSTFLAIVTPSS